MALAPIPLNESDYFQTHYRYLWCVFSCAIPINEPLFSARHDAITPQPHQPGLVLVMVRTWPTHTLIFCGANWQFTQQRHPLLDLSITTTPKPPTTTRKSRVTPPHYNPPVIFLQVLQPATSRKQCAHNPQENITLSKSASQRLCRSTSALGTHWDQDWRFCSLQPCSQGMVSTPCSSPYSTFASSQLGIHPPKRTKVELPLPTTTHPPVMFLQVLHRTTSQKHCAHNPQKTAPPHILNPLLDLSITTTPKPRTATRKSRVTKYRCTNHRRLLHGNAA